MKNLSKIFQILIILLLISCKGREYSSHTFFDTKGVLSSKKWISCDIKNNQSHDIWLFVMSEGETQNAKFEIKIEADGYKEVRDSIEIFFDNDANKTLVSKTFKINKKIIENIKIDSIKEYKFSMRPREDLKVAKIGIMIKGSY